jgi:hypothetical protein
VYQYTDPIARCGRDGDDGVMLRVLLVLLIVPGATMAFADGLSARPPCNSKLRWSFWPPEANADPALGRKMARDGKLEICTVVGLRYQWTPLTLNAKREAARKEGKSKGSEPNSGGKDSGGDEASPR